jgi:hypothetical protein
MDVTRPLLIVRIILDIVVLWTYMLPVRKMSVSAILSFLDNLSDQTVERGRTKITTSDKMFGKLIQRQYETVSMQWRAKASSPCQRAENGWQEAKEVINPARPFATIIPPRA